MSKTIRAKFSHGVFKPLVKIDLPEGEELEITIGEEKAREEVKEEKDPLDTTFGAWADIDCETLKKNIYADRQIHTRPEVKL